MTSRAQLAMDRAAERIVEDVAVSVQGQPTSSKTVQGLVGLVPVRAEGPRQASGHVAADLSDLWNLTAAAPRQVSGPSLQELDDVADAMAAVVAAQLGRVAGFAARNLGGVTIAASGLWNFQTGSPGSGTPRQAAVSPDDLAVIRGRWTVITDDVLGPKIAADYLAGAKGQHNRLVAALPPKVRRLAGRPLVDQAALLYAAGAANRLKGIGDELWQAARTALLEGMAKGESVDKLARRIRDATGVAIGRATTIARTESMGARSAGSYDEMLASGVVVSKTWQATGDLRTRPTHVIADGQTVPMAEKFTVGGWPADRPHDLMLPAEEAVNCRCTLTYGVDTDVAAGDMTLAEAIRARQVEMDAVGPLAEGIANLEELIPREDWAALRRHIDSLARHHTIDREMRDDWLAAVQAQDLRRLRRLVDRVAKDADLSPIGQAGQRVAFDPAVHTVLGGARGASPEVGVPVEVLRRGYRLVRGGESILLFKAVVEVLGTAASGLWIFHLPGKHDQASHGHGSANFAERFDAASTGSDALHDVDLMMDRPLSGIDRVGPYTDRDVQRSFASYRREGPEGFEGINDELRTAGGDRDQLSDAVRGHVDRMDAAFAESHAASDLAVYRGMDDPDAMFGSAYSRNRDLSGLEWTDHGYTSTTADRDTSDTFTLNNGIKANVLVRKGTPAVTLSGSDRESEILLRRGSRFRVVTDHGWTINKLNENVRVLDIEVI